MVIAVVLTVLLAVSAAKAIYWKLCFQGVQ